MLLILYVLDSLFFATPKSKRVLMGTKVGGEVHGEGQRKRKRASQRAWRVSYPFFFFFFFFSVFTRRSRSVFLYLYGVLEGERHGLWTLCFLRRPRVSVS